MCKRGVAVKRITYLDRCIRCMYIHSKCRTFVNYGATKRQRAITYLFTREAETAYRDETMNYSQPAGFHLVSFFSYTMRYIIIFEHCYYYFSGVQFGQGRAIPGRWDGTGWWWVA